jgi:futalosine hydrolase
VLILVPTAFEAALLFGETVRPTLLATGLATTTLGAHPVRVALCGFGLAAAGAGAAHVLARVEQAERLGLKNEGWAGGGTSEGALVARPVVLVGIGGTYDPEQAPVGSAVLGTFARCDGIGAGTGKHFISAEAMGWRQGIELAGLPPVGDLAPLFVPNVGSDVIRGGVLSVAATSAGAGEAAARRARYPDVLVEEMEAFAVALAARLARVPLIVVRGISDLAGDRDRSRWRIPEAIAAARALLEQVVSRTRLV